MPRPTLTVDNIKQPEVNFEIVCVNLPLKTLIPNFVPCFVFFGAAFSTVLFNSSSLTLVNLCFAVFVYKTFTAATDVFG